MATLISDAIELNGDLVEDNTWQVIFEDGIFTAKSYLDDRVKYFKLLKTPSELTDDERYSVLNYTLAKVSSDDKVMLRDIFLQAEFIEEMVEEYETTVRVSEYGEYDNTITVDVTIPKQENEDNIMPVLANAVREGVENDYGTHEAWDEGEVSWTVEDYQKL